ncbi:hypothetical protein HAX54_045816, partial [Datura stramonium]|nr:hypothetical protein [Datura stramonium]
MSLEVAKTRVGVWNVWRALDRFGSSPSCHVMIVCIENVLQCMGRRRKLLNLEGAKHEGPRHPCHGPNPTRLVQTWSNGFQLCPISVHLRDNPCHNSFSHGELHATSQFVTK